MYLVTSCYMMNYSNRPYKKTYKILLSFLKILLCSLCNLFNIKSISMLYFSHFSSFSVVFTKFLRFSLGFCTKRATAGIPADARFMRCFMFFFAFFCQVAAFSKVLQCDTAAFQQFSCSVQGIHAVKVFDRCKFSFTHNFIWNAVIHHMYHIQH